MPIKWSRVIEQFSPAFGISKPQIEDVYNKPDKTSIIGGNYISVKFYGGYAVLITFLMYDTKVELMNAYKIFPNMIKVDVEKAEAIDILVDFMDNFGMEVDVPGVGKVKTYVDNVSRKFFQGVLD
ncbi:hypothetical protein EPN87_03195, partial [archaeon]